MQEFSRQVATEIEVFKGRSGVESAEVSGVSPLFFLLHRRPGRGSLDSAVGDR